MPEIKSHEFLNEEKTHAKSAYGVEFKVGDTVGHEGADKDETAVILKMEFSTTHPPEIMATTTKGTAHLDFLYKV